MDIEITKEELEEIIEAYTYRGDESYANHVADIIWNVLKREGRIKDEED